MNYPASHCFLAPTSGLLLALAIGLVIGGIYAIPLVAVTTIVYLVSRPEK